MLLLIHEVRFTKPLYLAVNMHNTQPKTQYTTNRVTRQGDNIGGKTAYLLSPTRIGCTLMFNN